ncbi:HET-domain-containing protein [Hyaloscypha variabilis F]|uniref:HET-domain-containing protein n=1 Tax=Hyaloscypha variabilis (strain UAMH 11265 / GT02V1 / F) TaxID=1149755 RepID=A0A2J6R1Y6_HYAVF|nr:HET-domain-containing protein [Hyaloscypha variabilis F]
MAESATTPASQIYSPIYQRLRNTHLSSQRWFRLLRVLPGRKSDILRCQLEINDLGDAPPFEALSYVWGNPEPAKVIICNSQPKKVTPNLGTALDRLRHEHTERLVWIDAICVNQDDLTERSDQVKLMKDIYSQAWRVVVWLGEDEEENAETAITIIEKAAEYCYSDSGALLKDGDSRDNILRTVTVDPETPWSEKKQQRNLPDSRYEANRKSSGDWAAISKFYSNTWFTRIWIVQEVAFAPAVMYIGAHEVGWTSVAAAAKWLLAKGYTHVVQDSSRYRQAWSIYYLHLLHQTLSIPRLLGFVKSNSTDPRDKVFALLGFLDEESRSSPYLQPDYTKSVTEVYTDVVRYIIQRNSPRVGSLRNVWEVFGDIPSDPDERFPSWVYRWDLAVSESSLFYNAQKDVWSAGGTTTQEVAEITDTTILSLKGIKIGIVKEVNNVLHERQHKLERVQVLWNAVSPELAIDQDINSLQQAFTETITAEEVKTIPGDKTFGAEDLANYLSIPDWGNIYAILHERNESISKAMDLLMCINPKAFLVTEDNHMALGTPIARPGDVLCIFFGHHMPYLLRPTQQRYRFLGPCYVHGYMRGEAVDRLNRGDLKEYLFELQ